MEQPHTSQLAPSTALVEPKVLTLTEAAARRVRALQAKKGNPNLMLRVTVDGGGCAGFQYRFTFDDQTTDEDRTFAAHGVTIVSDETSLDLLGGAEIDFAEALIGSAFRIRNPNASGGCGCGASFSV